MLPLVSHKKGGGGAPGVNLKNQEKIGRSNGFSVAEWQQERHKGRGAGLPEKLKKSASWPFQVLPAASFLHHYANP